MRVRKCRRETASDFAALVRDGFLWCGLSLHRVWFVHRALVGGGWWRLGLHRVATAQVCLVPTAKPPTRVLHANEWDTCNQNIIDVRYNASPQGARGMSNTEDKLQPRK